MIRLDHTLTSDIQNATSGKELHRFVEAAIQLEFATIPPYLSAMLSLRPGSNREVWTVLHSVVVQEMLHLTIACNLLNALGGTPRLLDPGFLPTYPTSLPMSIGNFQVGLERYSPEQVQNVFMEIEEPEHPIALDATESPTFTTIGQFYAAVVAKLRELGDAAFTGQPERQVVAAGWFPEGQLHAIQSLADAERGIELIVEQGEGTETSPLAEGEIAHYYRFEQLVRGHRLVADPTAPAGYSYSGDPIPYDPSEVWPIRPNQRLEMLDPSSQAGRRGHQFAFVLSKLMRALQRTFDGDPGFLGEAMGLMFELKLAGQALVSVQDGTDDSGNPLHVGPVFQLTFTND